MPRKPRIHFPGALYHVMVRGNNKSDIFHDDYDYKVYLDKTDRYIKRYSASLFAYALMKNHCHMLIQVESSSISKIMQLIQQTYTAFYNRKYNHVGHVFAQRFKSILVDKDAYLLSVIKYIHNNPLKAGIGDLCYKYSSHRHYINADTSLCNIAEVLHKLGPTNKVALKRYLKLMEIKDDLYAPIDFYEVLKLDGSEGKELELPEKKNFNEIVSDFIVNNEQNIDSIKGFIRCKSKLQLRFKFISDVLQNKAKNQNELAEFLNISQSLVSRIYNKKFDYI